MTPTQQRRYALLASCFIIVYCLLRVVLWTGVLADGIYSYERMPGRANFFWLLHILFLFSVASFIRHEQRWAKILYFIYFGSTLLLFLPALLLYLNSTGTPKYQVPIQTPWYWVQWLLQLAAVVLLVLTLRGPSRSQVPVTD